MRRFGGLNFLLNNAGVLHIGSADQITEEQWDDKGRHLQCECSCRLAALSGSFAPHEKGGRWFDY